MRKINQIIYFYENKLEVVSESDKLYRRTKVTELKLPNEVTELKKRT